MDFFFFLNSILLGLGLAMDAFSVSVANGLNDSRMKTGKELLIAATFGIFQFALPMAGWFCVHYFLRYFTSFEPFIPWISLVLLLYIGIGMIREAGKDDDEYSGKLSFRILMVQGLATSIDALSVGFTIAEYPFMMALAEAMIIGVITSAVCMSGVRIGKVFGNRFSGKAEIAGGIILILIGIEIFIKGILS